MFKNLIPSVLSQPRSPKVAKNLFIRLTCVSVLFIGSCSNSFSQPILPQNTLESNSPSGDTISTTETTNSLPSLSALDQEFMARVAESDMIEIETSKLAAIKSINKNVTGFAERMIRSHTDSSQQLMQIAKSRDFHLPKDISSENQSLLMNLMQVPSGNNFNRAYMQGQVKVHSKTRIEFEMYIERGQDLELKTFAKKMSHVVTEHLQSAQRIAAQL